mmetsp:Transcript_296/g.650  ORF Transcript_296/g.650 Transcript_296/m.650 type:complete len:226 (+) Transcript_296:1088-1765(+)
MDGRFGGGVDAATPGGPRSRGQHPSRPARAGGREERRGNQVPRRVELHRGAGGARGGDGVGGQARRGGPERGLVQQPAVHRERRDRRAHERAHLPHAGGPPQQGGPRREHAHRVHGDRLQAHRGRQGRLGRRRGAQAGVADPGQAFGAFRLDPVPSLQRRLRVGPGQLLHPRRHRSRNAKGRRDAGSVLLGSGAESGHGLHGDPALREAGSRSPLRAAALLPRAP